MELDITKAPMGKVIATTIETDGTRTVTFEFTDNEWDKMATEGPESGLVTFARYHYLLPSPSSIAAGETVTVTEEDRGKAARKAREEIESRHREKVSHEMKRLGRRGLARDRISRNEDRLP